MAENLKVTIDNTEKIKRVLKKMQASVLVGIPQKENLERKHASIGNAHIAYINEFGSPAMNIEARPFMRPGIAAVEENVIKVLKAGIKKSLGDTPDESAINAALNQVGLMAASSIQMAITSGEGFKALSERTLKARRRRGATRDKPLIDTGALRQSITYVVKDNKAKVNGPN